MKSFERLQKYSVATLLFLYTFGVSIAALYYIKFNRRNERIITQIINKDYCSEGVSSVYYYPFHMIPSTGIDVDSIETSYDKIDDPAPDDADINMIWSCIESYDSQKSFDDAYVRVRIDCIDRSIPSVLVDGNGVVQAGYSHYQIQPKELLRLSHILDTLRTSQYKLVYEQKQELHIQKLRTLERVNQQKTNRGVITK